MALTCGPAVSGNGRRPERAQGVSAPRKRRSNTSAAAQRPKGERRTRRRARGIGFWFLMGFVLRVRLASFFAGAAAAATAGAYFLYKDYKLAHDSIALQVKGLHENLDERYKALDMRVRALEGHKEAAAAPDGDRVI